MLALAKRPEALWSLTHVQIGHATPDACDGLNEQFPDSPHNKPHHDGQLRHCYSEARHHSPIRKRHRFMPARLSFGGGLNADRRDNTLK